MATTCAKSLQKTGNCTIANTNITWHFALAEQHRKEHPGITLHDAFHALLAHPNKEIQKEGVKQFLLDKVGKFNDGKFKRQDYALELLKSLTVEEIATLKNIEIYDSYSAWQQLLDVTRTHQTGQWDVIQNVLSKLTNDHTDANYIKWAFEEAIKEPIKEAIIAHILTIDGEGELSSWYLMTVLETAHDEKRWDVVQAIISLGSKSALPPHTIAEVINREVKDNKWDRVAFILENKGKELADYQLKTLVEMRQGSTSAALDIKNALKYAKEISLEELIEEKIGEDDSISALLGDASSVLAQFLAVTSKDENSSVPAPCPPETGIALSKEYRAHVHSIREDGPPIGESEGASVSSGM